MKSSEEKRQRAAMQKEAAEKKSTSIRFSANDRKIINEAAAKKEMGFSEYVRDRDVHGESGLTPYEKAQMQTLMNTAYDIIKESDPEKAKQLQKGMAEVWTF